MAPMSISPTIATEIKSKAMLPYSSEYSNYVVSYCLSELRHQSLSRIDHIDYLSTIGCCVFQRTRQTYLNILLARFPASVSSSEYNVASKLVSSTSESSKVVCSMLLTFDIQNLRKLLQRILTIGKTIQGTIDSVNDIYLLFKRVFK